MSSLAPRVLTKRPRAHTSAALAAVVLGLAVSRLVGRLWQPARCERRQVVYLIPRPPGHKPFPSDLVAGGFALGLALASSGARSGWMLLGGTALLGAARVAAGVHCLADFLGGAAAGSVAGALVWRAQRAAPRLRAETR